MMDTKFLSDINNYENKIGEVLGLFVYVKANYFLFYMQDKFLIFVNIR